MKIMRLNICTLLHLSKKKVVVVFVASLLHGTSSSAICSSSRRLSNSVVLLGSCHRGRRTKKYLFQKSALPRWFWQGCPGRWHAAGYFSIIILRCSLQGVEPWFPCEYAARQRCAGGDLCDFVQLVPLIAGTKLAIRIF